MYPSLQTKKKQLETADWLNPRRRMYAERLLEHLVFWRGGKIALDAAGYRDVCATLQLDRFQVDGAADDLYTLGAIDLSMGGGGDWPVLVAMVRDLEELARGPKHAAGRSA